MKIVSIEARAIDRGFQKQVLQTSRVASPMSRFPRFGEKRSSWMWPTKKVFVRVVTEDGTTGWSCTNGGEIVAMIVNDHLSRLLVGEQIGDIASLWDQMFFSLLPCDRSGFSMMAVSGVDIALWDLAAKTQGQSLVSMLGGSAQSTLSGTLPVYVTTPQPEVHGAAGWRGLKAAAPFGPETGQTGLQANVDYMRKFRDVAGTDVPIMIDAFMAWDADYTLQFLDAAHDLNLHWIEDPIPPYDIEGMKRIKSEMDPSVSLALGNFAFSRWDCADLLREGLVDVLQPDVAWAGGISETLRILDMADAADVPVILHNTCEQPWALALAAARQADALVEFVDRGAESQLYGLMGPPAVFSQGCVAIPNDISGNRPQPDVEDQFAPVTAGAHMEGR